MKTDLPTPSSHQNQVALLTGASDGIGRAMALALAARGFKLGLMARRYGLLSEVAKECLALGSPQVEIIAVDVCHASLFRKALEDLETRFNGVDYFIANAGVNSDISACVDGTEDATRVIEVNVIAAIAGLEYFKSRWIERRHGVLAAVSSVAGARGLPASGVYCASKAAISIYLESLRLDLRKYGIKVIDIVPGFIDTDMTRRNINPKPFMIDAQRAGEVFVNGLLKGKSRVIGPWPFVGIYWVLRHIPHFVYQGVGALLGKLKPES